MIGVNALNNNSWVKRAPSDIYWAGLRTYGIFAGGRLSLSEYVYSSCNLKTQKSTLKKLGNRNDEADEYEKDDKNAGDLFNKQFWKIPTYSDNWMDNFTMALTKEEADFLSDQIQQNCKGSMLAYVLKHRITEIVYCDSFEDIGNIIHLFPEDIKENYYIALKFSEFVYAIRTVYNVIVSDGENERANAELERQRAEYETIADIDIDDMFERLSIFSNPLLRKFLKQAKECMFSDDIDRFKKIIVDREIHLKGSSRAKTMHRGEFDTNAWFSGYGLDYRFRNTKRIIKDIMEGAELLNVESK